MTITTQSPFKSAPRVSKAGWLKEIAVAYDTPLFAGIPKEDRPAVAASMYDRTVAKGHDPLTWLAIGFCEHSLGANPNSVLHRNDTRSLTNARTVRMPGIGYDIIRDSVRGSNYVRYRSVVDSLADGIYRVDEPGYAYRNANAVSIIDHTMIWTEGDGPEYAAKMAAFMNRVIASDTGDPPMAGDDSRFQWVADLSEFGYPQGRHGRNGKPIDYLIVHVTEGRDSLAWLVDEHGSSAHYLTRRDATPRAQMVREADAAWTAGNRDYNERGINVEFERFARDPWTDVEYRNAAATVHPMLKRHNIPIAFLGRNSAGKRGLLGHEHVPDGSGGWGGTTHHSDPGKQFNWDRFIAELQSLDGGTQPPTDDRILVEGNPFGDFGYALGFKGRLQQIGAAVNPTNVDRGILAWAGWAKGDEYTADDGCAYQVCERGNLQWTPGVNPPFDIVMMLQGDEPPPRKER